VICDVLGKAGFPRSVRALAPRGRYLLIGFPDGMPAIAAALLRGLWLHTPGRAVFMTGAAKPVPSDLEFLRSLIEGDQLRPVIGSAFATSSTFSRLALHLQSSGYRLRRASIAPQTHVHC